MDRLGYNINFGGESVVANKYDNEINIIITGSLSNTG